MSKEPGCAKHGAKGMIRVPITEKTQDGSLLVIGSSEKICYYCVLEQSGEVLKNE